MHKGAIITRATRIKICTCYTTQIKEYALTHRTVHGTKYLLYTTLSLKYHVHVNTIKKIIRRGKYGDFDLHKSTRYDYICYKFRGKRKFDTTHKRLQKAIDRNKIIRYNKEHAGELGHIDLHKLRNIVGEDPKKKKYQATLLDDATRMTYSETLGNKRACTVADFMRRAIKWFKTHGITFQALLSDNGLEFTTHHKESKCNHVFEKMLIKNNIKHKYTKIHRPQTNGKVERWWQILENELFRKHSFTSWGHFQRCLNDWLHFYNYKRPHGGINKLTPWRKYQETLQKKAE